MAMFKAFKPSGMEKIARAMGYSGNMQGFQDYLAQNPMRQQQMQTYQQKAMQMAKGGVVRMQTGGAMMGPLRIPEADMLKPGVTPEMAASFPQMPTGVGPLFSPAVQTAVSKEAAPFQQGQFAPGNLAQAQNQMQMSGMQGMTPVMSDPGGPAMGLQPTLNIASAGGPGTGGFSGSLFVPDTTRPKSEDQLQAEWKRLQESARKARAEGFMGQVVMPGEGSYEDWKQLNQYELMRNPDAPDSLYNNFNMTGMGDPNLAVSNYIPQQPTDPYQQYRQNVEKFSETGTFKNPNIQIKFDAMTEALQQDDSNDPLGTKKTQAITDYIKTIYTGPITLADTGATGLGANELTPEFQQFARDVGITIKQGLAADGPKVFELAEGSPIATIPGFLPAGPSGPSVTDVTIGQMYQPALPAGAVTQAAATPLAQEQMIDPGTGTVTGAVSVPTTIAGTAMATPVQEQQAAQMQAAQAAPAVDSALASTQAAQGTIDPRAEVLAAQQTASSVGNVTAAQGQAVLIDNPVQREIQAGELISGAAADANKAAQFTEQVQAAEATPSTQATIQGQLAQLTANFDANNPPAWAAGALRNATAQMAARGLGASSLAGQAIIQATMESALPIAQADASIFATFEQQNLTNRQQRAMLAAQQRAQFMGQEFDQAFQAKVANAAKISDIANQNFTAEQQVQLENSRAANTMNLNNLSNKQAKVMAEAAALAQMDTQNLNNLQQAAVQNAQNFLQMDMQNLSNKQQTEIFKAQQRTQALFTDQAATNAAAQFNATSENQVNQFFANLASQVSQFNATQANAQAQFNAGQVNTVERFNAELNNQRDQFNATNQLAIAQSNAVWRREIATADTAAVNRANELNANAILDMSKTAYDNLWTYYADTMEWAWESAESELERLNNLAIANLDADAAAAASKAASSSAAGSALGNLIGTLGSAWIRWCWVAREVYGPENTDWLVFRDWMLNKAPNWLRNLYGKYGESFASYISNKPRLKKVIKFAMNKVVKKHKKEYTNYVK